MNYTDPQNKNFDAIYYRDGVKNPIAMKMLKLARSRLFQLFMKEMQPGPRTQIIDIGVSDEENEGANFLEKLYPWQQNITCVGIGAGHAIQSTYPHVSYQQIVAGQPLPFNDQTFDIACSNAVLEHVGGSEERKTFISEHLRVAKAIFISVPNRWFPVEHHTHIPLLHYSPILFRGVLSTSRYKHWTKPANVDFISRNLILSEWPHEKPPRIIMTGLPMGPFSSNLAAIWNRQIV